MDELLTGGAGALLLALLAFLGLRFFAKPDKGKRAGQRDVPDAPPPPDTTRVDRDVIVEDHEAEKVETGVDAALSGDGPPENPHGLADLVNNRRR